MNREERMAWLRAKAKKLQTYKYPLLVLLLGAGLLLLPRQTAASTAQQATAAEPEHQETAVLEERLAALLEQLDGAGEVEVLLTFKEGMEYTYQTDVETATTTDGQERQEQTVLVSDGAGGEGPLTRKTTYPVYQGAVVLCQGADSAAVRLDITQAVCSLTGLSSEKITVIKMKR